MSIKMYKGIAKMFIDVQRGLQIFEGVHRCLYICKEVHRYFKIFAGVCMTSQKFTEHSLTNAAKCISLHH
jgi:hypothetical protein